MGSVEITTEEELDHVFNELEKNETLFENLKFKEKFSNQQTVYEGTPLNFVKKFLSELNPNQNQIIYDLGSGLGRVVIYAQSTVQRFLRE